MNKSLMSGRLIALLVLVSAVSLLALALLFAYAPYLRRDNSNDTDVVSRSAVGFAGLKQYLSLSGVPVEIDNGPLMRTNATPSLVVLTPSARTDAAEISAYALSAPTLIILPKWVVVPVATKPHWVSKFDILNSETVAEKIAGIAKGAKLTVTAGTFRKIETYRGIAAPPGLTPATLTHVEELRVISGIRGVLQVKDRGSVLGMVRRDNQPVYILADPDLMNNHGLADAANARNARAIVAALRQGTGPVRFDVTLNGMARDPSLLRAVFEPPFLGATACFLLAAMLVGLHAASRFGAPLQEVRAFARGKKMLALNTAGLLRIMGREGAMAQRYVQSARDLALSRLGARRSSAPEQDELLAIIEHGASIESHYASLSEEARRAEDGADLIRIAKKAHAWRKGVTRGH